MNEFCLSVPKMALWISHHSTYRSISPSTMPARTCLQSLSLSTTASCCSVCIKYSHGCHVTHPDQCYVCIPSHDCHVTHTGSLVLRPRLQKVKVLGQLSMALNCSFQWANEKSGWMSCDQHVRMWPHKTNTLHATYFGTNPNHVSQGRWFSTNQEIAQFSPGPFPILRAVLGECDIYALLFEYICSVSVCVCCSHQMSCDWLLRGYASCLVATAANWQSIHIHIETLNRVYASV